MVYNLILVYDKFENYFQLIKRSQIGRNNVLVKLRRFNINVYDLLNSGNKSVLIYVLDDETNNLKYLSNINKLISSRMIFCYSKNFTELKNLKEKYPNASFVLIDTHFTLNLENLIAENVFK